MADALKVRGLAAGYGETQVLEQIDLTVAANESLSVIGRNGVGKTTLLGTIMGHTTMHGGEIILEGRRIDRLPVHERALAGLGFVPQEREIFSSLSVRENLEIGMRPGYWSAERIYEMFPNLRERLRNTGSQLSGGEQQMLAIARALVTNPRVLLMDEPTEGLAPVVVRALIELLGRIRVTGNMAIILVEQNSRVALDFSARTVVMDKGRIVYDGPSSRLRDDAEYLASLIAVESTAN